MPVSINCPNCDKPIVFNKSLIIMRGIDVITPIKCNACNYFKLHPFSIFNKALGIDKLDS